MATSESGVNKVKYDAGGSGDNYLDSGQYGAEVKCIQDQFEASGITTGSTISVVNMPKGSKIVGCTVAFDALGTSSTIQLGDALDDDRYIAATSSVSAGATSAIRVDGIGYTIGTTATDEVIKLKVATSASINGTIKVVILYVQG